VDGRVADHLAVADGHEEQVWRLVLDNELLPVLSGEHRLADEVAEVGPTGEDGRVEDRSDRGSVREYCGSQRDSRRPRSDLVHEMPPRALGSRV